MFLLDFLFTLFKLSRWPSAGIACDPIAFMFCRHYNDRFDFEGRMWDLIVSVPNHCLSFYFVLDRI